MRAREKTRKNKLKTWEIASNTDRSVDNFFLDEKPTGPPSGGGIKGANAPAPHALRAARCSGLPGVPPAARWRLLSVGLRPPTPWRASPPPLPSQRLPHPVLSPMKGIIVGERQRSPLYFPERACTSCRVHSPVLAPGFFSPSPEHFSVVARVLGTPHP